MRYYLLAWTVFLALCALAFARGAEAKTGHHKDPLTIAQTAWKGSPCTGKLSIKWTENLSPGDVGQAIGIIEYPNGRWIRTSCVMAISPSYYHKAGYDEKLAIVLHEAGHLAHGTQHHKGEGWIMSADHSGCKPLCNLFPTYNAKAVY